MADPGPIDLTANQWNLVASNVFSGNITRKSTKPTLYLQTFRVVSLGNPPPTDEDEGVPLFEHEPSEPIKSSDAINIYVWPKDKAGRVRVDI